MSLLPALIQRETDDEAVTQELQSIINQLEQLEVEVKQEESDGEDAPRIEELSGRIARLKEIASGEDTQQKLATLQALRAEIPGGQVSAVDARLGGDAEQSESVQGAELSAEVSQRHSREPVQRLGGLATALIIGVVVGVVAGVALGIGTIVGGIALYRARRRRRWRNTLDQLLGANNDPGGIRQQLMNAAGDQPTLQAAVDTIVAAVPAADRVAMLNAAGNDAGALVTGTLGTLLTVATSPSGAGSPELRLYRVLESNPGTARTVVALTPLLTAQIQIDEKILRGSTPVGVAPLGGVGIPTGQERSVIGGHGPEIQADPATYLVENVVHNPNLTDWVTFRKLVRGDAANFAANVTANAPGNIVAAFDLARTAALAVAAVPPALPAPFLANAPVHVVLARQNAQAAAVVNINNANVNYGNARPRVINAAGAVAAAPNNATALSPFIDAVTDLHASALAALTAAQAAAAGTVNAAVVAPDIVALGAAMHGFRTTGPVLSTTKRSTVAPPGMTEDDILRAGDETVAVPATLFRRRPDYAPAHNDEVETKHQRVSHGVVWIAIKERVIYNRPNPGVAPTLTGGEMTSSYPTQGMAILPDPPYVANPIDGDTDTDGFISLPP